MVHAWRVVRGGEGRRGRREGREEIWKGGMRWEESNEMGGEVCGEKKGVGWGRGGLGRIWKGRVRTWKEGRDGVGGK